MASDKSGLIVSTVVMAVIAVSLFSLAYAKGQGACLEGTRRGLSMMVHVLPLLVMAFLVIGLFSVVVPKDYLARWVGDSTGLRGVLIGSLCGGVFPGGPLIHTIAAAGFLKAGAGIGAIVAFLVAGVLWGLPLLPLEIGIIGWKVIVVRLASTFFFPPLAGMIAHFLFGGPGK